MPGRSRPYGTVRQTIRSSSSSETTESEQVYLRGGSKRAFPQSLIRDSGSEKEEVRGRGDEGRWRWRRARTGCIGVWQRANREMGKMDLWGQSNDEHPLLLSAALKSVWVLSAKGDERVTGW